MNLNIIGSGVQSLTAQGGGPPPPPVDPFWNDVVLLLDESKHSAAIDPFWTDVVLLLDESKT